MKLIEPSYEILTPINELEFYTTIEKAARTCYKSENKIKEGSAELLVKNLIKNNHLAMIEFAPKITVKFIHDRAFTHELVRHRLCSFAQESQRFVRYDNKEMEFIRPHWLSLTRSMIDPVENIKYETFISACETAENKYNILCTSGLKAQDARAVLPNAVKTEICVSTNVREWRSLLQLRTANNAHPEMLRVMRPLLDEFKQKLPLLFNDIVY